MPEKGEALAIGRFRAMLEEVLFPSVNSVELTRTAQSDYNLRFSARQPHIAELFQENTKLTPFSTMITANAEAEFKEARDWYFTTPYRPRKEDVDENSSVKVRLKHDEMTSPLRPLMVPFAQQSAVANLLFSLDLFLLDGGCLLRQLPKADFLWNEFDVLPPQEKFLRASILGLEPKVLQETETWLFVAGAPWRYMMFFGPRGYRRMMFDTGALLAHLESAAAGVGLRAVATYDFFDARLNQVLQLDGTERTVLAVVALSKATV